MYAIEYAIGGCLFFFFRGVRVHAHGLVWMRGGDQYKKKGGPVEGKQEETARVRVI